MYLFIYLPDDKKSEKKQNRNEKKVIRFKYR